MELLLHYLDAIHELSPALREHLQVILQHRSLAKKEYLLKAGRTACNIYFIEKGLLRCYYCAGDKEVSSWFMKEGDVVISVESFYKQTPAQENIQALEECSLYRISYSELQDIYTKFPEFNYTGRVVTEKYYKLWAQQLYGMRMLFSHERYAWLQNNYPDLLVRVPARHLASFIGVTEVRYSAIRKTNQ